MTTQEKEGSLLFFGKAGCVECHAVAGTSNQMFSDFKDHNIGVPQLVPRVTNVGFDGPGANEDFGQEQFTGNPEDRYKFRTAPLRNILLNAAYMHDGAFTSLRAAIVHHLNVVESDRRYDPAAQHLPGDLTSPIGPLNPILQRLDPRMRTPTHLTDEEIDELVAFVGYGLLDPRAEPDQLRRLVPASVPSGRPVLRFQFPQDPAGSH
jgi:cytochrome c peroxidase